MFKKILLIVLVVTMFQFYGEEPYIIQDFGVCHTTSSSFLSPGQVIRVNNGVYFKSPVNGVIVGELNDNLENRFGDYKVKNLILIRQKNGHILGVYNINHSKFKTGDKIKKGDVIGQNIDGINNVFLIYIQTPVDDFNVNSLLNIADNNETSDIDYVYLRFSDYFDISELL